MLRWRAGVSILTAGTPFALSRHAHLFPGIPQVVIPNPMDVVSPRHSTPARLRNVGYLGTLHPNKGVHLLLEAADALTRRGVKTHIAGGGPLESAVRDAARRGVVHYHGVVQDSQKDAFLAMCDLGIVPSVWLEPGGPPNVVLEWLGAGRPVLAAPRGCLSELIGGRVRSVEPDAADIERQVARLLEEEEWLALMREAAPDVVLQTEATWLDAFEGLFRNVRHPLRTFNA